MTPRGYLISASPNQLQNIHSNNHYSPHLMSYRKKKESGDLSALRVHARAPHSLSRALTCPSISSHFGTPSTKLQDGQNKTYRMMRLQKGPGQRTTPRAAQWAVGNAGLGGRKGSGRVSRVGFLQGAVRWEANSCWSAEACRSAAMPSPGDLRRAPTPSAASTSPTALGCGVHGRLPRSPRFWSSTTQSPTISKWPARLPRGAGDSLETPGSVLDALAGRPGDVSHLGTSVSPPVKQDGEVKGAM